MYHKLKKGSIIISSKMKTASSFMERLIGLMFRKSFDKDEGMYIPNCKMIHTCFMNFDIDAIFVDQQYRILKCIEGLKPWRFSSFVYSASGVFELPSGSIEGYGLKPGDPVELIVD